MRTHHKNARAILCPYCSKPVRENTRICPACRATLGPLGTPREGAHGPSPPPKSPRRKEAAQPRSRLGRLGSVLLALVFVVPAIFLAQAALEGRESGIPLPVFLLIPIVLGIVYKVLVRR